MYLVIDPTTRFYIFTDQDPRNDGYDGSVRQDVRLDESDTLNALSNDSTAAVPCLGCSPSDEKHFRVFESFKQCRLSGFEPCGNVYAKYQSWIEFLEE